MNDPRNLQVKALLSRTVTDSNGRSAGGGRAQVWGTKSRSVASANTGRAGARRRAQVIAVSSSNESSEQDEAESAAAILGQAAALIDANGAEKYQRLREIHLSDLSPAAEELANESGCKGMDDASWKETSADKLALGSFAQKNCTSSSDNTFTHREDKSWQDGAEEEEEEERVDAAATLSGDGVQEGALNCRQQFEDRASVHTARSGEEFSDVAGQGSEGERIVARDEGEWRRMGACAAWELVRDVFEEDENSPFSLHLPAPMPTQDGMVPSSRAEHGVPDADSLAGAGVNSSQSDYGCMLVSLERLNASPGIEANVEQDARMQSHDVTDKGRGSQFDGGQEDVQMRNDDGFIQRLDEIERQREIEHRELQALRREVTALRMNRQRAEEVARLEIDLDQEKKHAQSMWHMRMPKSRDRGGGPKTERQASWVHSSHESVPSGLETPGPPLRDSNGGRNSLLCIGDLRGLRLAGQVPAIVPKLCKQLGREAKLHLESLKSIVKGSRENMKAASVV